MPEAPAHTAELYVFPYLKRTASKNLPQDVQKEHMDLLAKHLTKQIIHQLHNHGFTINKAFQRDMDLIHEGLRSITFRSIGAHHELQEYVDDLYKGNDSQLNNIKGIIKDEDPDTTFGVETEL